MCARQCIYCLKFEPEVSFTKKAHVIPESFGGTLQINANGLECDACNQFFGDQPERVLARDTLEAHLRVTFGIKSPEDFKSMGPNSRITTRCPSGPYKGAFCYLRYVPGSKVPARDQIPQVGLKRLDRAELDWFLPDDVPPRDALDANVYDLQGADSLHVLSDDPETILEALKSKGYVLKDPRPTRHRDAKGEFDAKVDIRIDRPVVRAIAKIAFSYLAAICGAEVALRSDFEPIRRFILHGEGDRIIDFVQGTRQSVLGDAVVHIVTIHFDQRDSRLYGHVSLFNSFKWRVLLGEGASFALKPSGHVFDIGTRTITALSPVQVGDDIAWELSQNLS